MQKYSASIAVILLLLATACRNRPAVERDRLRDQVSSATQDNVGQVRADLLQILAGSETEPASGDPHLRATAVQGLGEIGSLLDAGILLDTLMGPLQDGNILVRVESAIALGKLKYADNRNLRRATIARLRNRLAFERNERGQLFEPEFMVRVSMLNSIIAIGGRTAATGVYDVAVQLNKDIQSPSASKFTSATDRGILDRCIEGLILLTDADRKAAASNRNASVYLAPHFDWWTLRISEMPED